MSIKELIIKIKYMPANIYNKVNMYIRRIEFGSNLHTYGLIFIRGTGKISIGNDVTINSCLETNPIGGSTKAILYAKKNGFIKIGNHVGISNTAIVSLSKIIIEDDVLIGGNCKIYDNDFHSLEYGVRMLPGDVGVKTKPIHIKCGAFIGGHSIILKGVTIGEHSIVGAGSVVTKSIPDNEIWAGNPARFVKKIGENNVLKGCF